MHSIPERAPGSSAAAGAAAARRTTAVARTSGAWRFIRARTPAVALLFPRPHRLGDDRLLAAGAPDDVGVRDRYDGEGDADDDAPVRHRGDRAGGEQDDLEHEALRVREPGGGTRRDPAAPDPDDDQRCPDRDQHTD